MSQTPRDTAGLNLDADEGEAPAFWRCLCCPFSTTSYDAILEHAGETGHGFVADNAYADLLERYHIESDRLIRLMALVYEGHETQRRIEAMDAAQLTAYLDALRAASLDLPDAPLADLLEANRTYQAEHAPDGFRSARVGAAPEIADNWDPAQEEAMLLRLAPFMRELADSVRAALPSGVDFGLLIMIPGPEPRSMGRVVATTSNRQRIAAGAAQWAINALEHP